MTNDLSVLLFSLFVSSFFIQKTSASDPCQAALDDAIAFSKARLNKVDPVPAATISAKLINVKTQIKSSLSTPLYDQKSKVSKKHWWRSFKKLFTCFGSKKSLKTSPLKPLNHKKI